MRKIIYLSLLWACAPTEGITEKIDVPTMEEAVGSQPTSEPSAQPSSEPSTQPSNEPTSEPSNEPSQPSNEPSQPSGEPTSEPSQPANEPSSTEDPCDSSSDFELWTANMEYTVGCSWGSGGNLSPVQGKYSARTEQEVTYTPPSGYQICDILFDFESDAGEGLSGLWGYDDEFIITLNDRVLVSSQASLMSNLSPVSNTYEYSWNSIKNGDQSFMPPDYFYIGGASEFEAPEPPEVGFSYMYIGSNALDPHRNLAISENEIRLMMVTLGDNDDGDCFNNGFLSNVTVYIAPE